MQCVHNPYTMRMYTVYGPGGLRPRAVGCVNGVLRFGGRCGLGGVEVPDQVRDCAGVGLVKTTGLRRVGFTHPTVSISSVAHSVQPTA